VRVISGIARGRRLKSPPGSFTRPLTDRIKEALFNVIGWELPGSRVLDLFAGSGSFGIEALSRGASQVVFVESHALAVRTIHDNLSTCQFESGFEVWRNDVFRALPLLARRGLSFDFIFADPPFTMPGTEARVVEVIDQLPLLAARGCLIVRIPRRKTLVDEWHNLEQFRSDDYGESTVVYCRYREAGGDIDGVLRDTR
jgi:16S rRNA (guanine966-N2)-methyltransferase